MFLKKTTGDVEKENAFKSRSTRRNDAETLFRQEIVTNQIKKTTKRVYP